MAKTDDATKSQRTQRAFSVTRRQGMWVYEYAVIPEDVFRRYVVEEHGPDLFGMCSAKLEVDLSKERER